MLMHDPGPMVDLVQRCNRCGEVLVDYRNASVAVRPGHPEDAVVRGWAEGVPILRTLNGGYTELYEEGDTAADWVICSRHNRQEATVMKSNGHD